MCGVDRRLHRVERAPARHAFDRLDRGAVDLWREHEATAYGTPVEHHGAGTARTLLAPDVLPTFPPARFEALGAQLDAAGLANPGPLALIELQNGGADPSFVAGTENFYVITRYNWSSYYAMAVIELGQAVADARGR